MIKSELVQKIADRIRTFISAISRTSSTPSWTKIVNALARGDRVELRGFGAFSVKKRAARIGRNPRTGETVEVGEKYPRLQDRQGNARAPQPGKDDDASFEEAPPRMVAGAP